MKPYNVATYREAARRRLPRAVFDYVDGGADDEVTLRANRSAFEHVRLRYRVQRSGDAIALATTLCDQKMTMPVMIAPIGNVGMVHPAADLAMARLAADLGLVMVMSSSASYSIQEVAAGVERKPWYQLYPWIDRGFYGALIEEAAVAGFRGLVFTMDTGVRGNRERDTGNSFSPRGGRVGVGEMLRHPRWTWGVLRHRRVLVQTFRETRGRPPLLSLLREARQGAGKVTSTMMMPTWDELAWIRDQWSGPLGVKGIVHPADAERAVELGADVIFVSNHGGRQLDTAPATLEALPAIVDAVGGRAQIVLDGGVRRATDVIKALCMGARAISVGRPWVYGLAAAGPVGAQRVLEGFRRELTIAMTLLGERDVTRLDESWLIPAGVPGLVVPDLRAKRRNA